MDSMRDLITLVESDMRMLADDELEEALHFDNVTHMLRSLMKEIQSVVDAIEAGNLPNDTINGELDSIFNHYKAAELKSAEKLNHGTGPGRYHYSKFNDFDSEEF